MQNIEIQNENHLNFCGFNEKYLSLLFLLICGYIISSVGCQIIWLFVILIIWLFMDKYYFISNAKNELKLHQYDINLAKIDSKQLPSWVYFPVRLFLILSLLL